MSAREDHKYLRVTLRLARRGYGLTSPNPMVGAVLVKGGRIIGRGWHRRAGQLHAEIEALRDAQKHGHDATGATLYVTLEPCSTHGRTPPCTQAIIGAGIKKVVAGATDPNPRHCGRGFSTLQRAGVAVRKGILADECEWMNEEFNHWIVHRTPFVLVKAAMSLDGKIATATGESKWITGERARACGMKLRQGVDAILVGINTVLADDPALTVREKAEGRKQKAVLSNQYSVTSDQYSVIGRKGLRRIILDALARTPLSARIVNDANAALTTIVVSKKAPKHRRERLARRVRVLMAPSRAGKIDLRWLLQRLGAEQVTSLLVEGGGEVNASFILGGFAHRIAFFYAPTVIGGRYSPKAVASEGVKSVEKAVRLQNIQWRKLGQDLLLEARVVPIPSQTMPRRKA